MLKLRRFNIMLDVAIERLDDVIKTIKCKECKDEHIQLYHWLCELRDRRNNELS